MTRRKTAATIKDLKAMARQLDEDDRQIKKGLKPWNK
jgi:hypothetical protein